MKRIIALLLVAAIFSSLIVPVSASSNTYYPTYYGYSTSLVDGLNVIGEDSSFAARTKIAQANGISFYMGTAEQNTYLLNLLKQGQLVKTVEAVNNSVFERNPYVCYNYQQCTANDHDVYEITKQDAPLRQEPRNTGKVIARLSEGQLLSVAQIVRNEKNNDWMRVEYTDEDGIVRNAYMYSGNCTAHRHVYTNVLNNSNGTLKICTKCAYSIVTANGQSIEKELISVLDQAVMGDYSQDDMDFWGLAARVLVGEIPYVGTAADVRDLVYDLTHNAHIGIIALDAIALVPLIGILKNADELYALKYANDIANTGEMVVKVGKYNLSADTLRTFMFGKVIDGKKINGKNVRGAHNMQNFLQAITENGGELNKCIQTPVKHPTVDGIYNITYRVSETKDYAKYAKTVYDPNVISDSQMFIWATEALSNANLMSDTSDYIVGWASNGLKFVGEIDSAGNIVHFYPQFD